MRVIKCKEKTCFINMNDFNFLLDETDAINTL